ncbi:uncharacterized protein [Porites lutea]|uniref:uncharacterized protein n=1 Tax=Porites lutea TaxID=51062 RepID=UPI003CC69693
MGIFATFPSISTAFSQGSIGNFFYANFMISEFSYLNITSIGRNLIQDENDCGYACLEIPSCFSYNVAAFPDVNGKLLCELLPSDKFNNSDKFNASKEFHHFYIPSPCHSSPCKNTGKCISLYQENGYKCICIERFTGKDCETNINECESSPCLNNGTCTDRGNGFNCSCPPGFSGDRCEIDTNECESSPCLNNGTCTDRINAFNCSCPPGFSGNRCEIDTNECESSPCLNNGNCTDRINAFNCSCFPGFAGNRCEIDINECKSNPCLNNGTCTDRANGFNCSCPPKFIGKRCEQDIISTVVTQFLSPAFGNDSNWALCWQASTHGWAASTFHSRCDGKNHTITVIRKDPYVFGGYTDISWSSVDQFAATSKSFIFSLVDKEGLAPFKSMVKHVYSSYAIYRYSSYGPTFGDGHDIYIADNANQNTGSYNNFGTSYSLPNNVTDRYTILAGTRYFSPDEVEVFYLA